MAKNTTTKPGRPTDYKPEYAEQARKLCLLGATDKDLASFFQVDEQTINNWKTRHQEFFGSIKDGKETADAQVAERLYLRAMGYEHPDTDIKVISNKIVKTKIVKAYPPDTTACIFWLKNRQRDKWRDKQDHEITGKDGGPIEHKYTDDELESRIIDLARKAGISGAP